MLDERDVGAAMRAETSTPAPESTVDISRAVRDGRRRNRRTRIAAGATIAAVTALALIGGTIGIRQLSTPDTRQATGGRGTSSAAPRTFDPAHRRVEVGWLPSDLPSVRQNLTTTAQRLSYVQRGEAPDGTGTRSPAREIDVDLYAKGVEPGPAGKDADGGPSTQVSPSPTAHRPPSLPPAPTDTSPQLSVSASPSATADESTGPTIGGRRSQWTGTVPADSTLRWEWAPGAWITVRAKGFGDTSTARPIVARVARAVRTRGVDVPVRMPFTLPRPALPLVETESGQAPDGTYDVGMSFSDTPTMRDGKSGPARILHVSLSSGATRTADDGKPGTTIDGHPALVQFGTEFRVDAAENARDAGRIVLYGMSGWRVDMTAYDAWAEQSAKSGLLALATDVDVVSPDLRNPEHWTTRPLR